MATLEAAALVLVEAMNRCQWLFLVRPGRLRKMLSVTLRIRWVPSKDDSGTLCCRSQGEARRSPVKGCVPPQKSAAPREVGAHSLVGCWRANRLTHLPAGPLLSAADSNTTLLPLRGPL